MQILTGKLFKEMVLCGANTLHNNHPEIDALNVFPVPDGDTGTNMSMTFNAGAAEIKDMDSDNIYDIAKKLSKGLLMGARGNSGVILSQIFRGFAMGLEGHESVDAVAFANAWKSGAEVAYKAVMRPVEGTILTVIRESSEKIVEYTQPGMEIEDVFSYFVKEAENSLERTPELLPVLKEVGVVDSGGKGLCIILEGFLSAMKGEVIAPSKDASSYDSAQTKIEGGEEEFGFCTEFILHLTPTGIKHFSEEDFKNELATIGNSIVCVQDDDLVKVHVHTLEPQTAIKMGKRRGRFMKLKIENMQEQHDNILEKEQEEEVVAEHKKYAIITVAPGKGIDAMFKELRADIVVGGGQTMNPSTEDFVSAIGKVNADHIIILPNNSNIVLAANQACQVCEDKDIHVLPTKTIPQGLSACIMFNPEVDIEDNLAEMQEAIDHVKSGEVTYAIKDTTYEGLEIKKDEYMGIFGKAIVVSDPDMMASTKALLDKMLDEDSELVTLIYGDTATLEQAEEIAEYIEDTSDAEVEIHEGNQPVYSFIIGVE